MAEEKPKAKVKPKVETKPKFKYFRSTLAGLKIVYDNDTENPLEIKSERFVARQEVFQGDTVKIGYLKTSNPKVIERCKLSPFVGEIKKEQYEEAVS